MLVLLWIVVALGAAFAVVQLSVRSARRRLPPLEFPLGEAMPTTPLQRLARRTLAGVSLLTVLAAGVVGVHGLQGTWSSDRARLVVTVLLLAALAVFAFYNVRIGAWNRRDDGSLDERDQAILASAPAGQAPAMLVTLAVWMIALTETYHSAGAVPSAALYALFWSVLMASVVALLAGVLVGYRRS